MVFLLFYLLLFFYLLLSECLLYLLAFFIFSLLSPFLTLTLSYRSYCTKHCVTVNTSDFWHNIFLDFISLFKKSFFWCDNFTDSYKPCCEYNELWLLLLLFWFSINFGNYALLLSLPDVSRFTIWLLLLLIPSPLPTLTCTNPSCSMVNLFIK